MVSTGNLNLSKTRADQSEERKQPYLTIAMHKSLGMLNVKDYNATSLAQPTDFNSMLRSGELLWGTGCRIPHEEAARIVAATPHHFCFIDAVGSPLPSECCVLKTNALMVDNVYALTIHRSIRL
jgi:hypothetical protein